MGKRLNRPSRLTDPMISFNPPARSPNPGLLPDTRREQLLERLRQASSFDLAVIGGGATGLAIALQAARDGYSVVLLEAGDFASGTSSRSTKLLHGGVRYLAQGNLKLVREALHERTRLLHWAPGLAQPLRFVVPAYRWWERLFYGTGLFAYDLLAGAAGLGRTRWIPRSRTLATLPGLRDQGLRGGVAYWDAQFDDAGLALALASTAAASQALLVNRMRVVQCRETAGRITGLELADLESAGGGQRLQIAASCVVNATGVWVDGLRAGPPLVQPSQGAHVVLDRDFLPGDAALLVPRTEDGRVLFAVPWLGKVVVGTTDTAYPSGQTPPTDPMPFEAEVDFILREAARYLARAPGRRDIRSAWAGLRPLMRASTSDTKSVSREHVIEVAASGLVTVTGGKWTTCLAMADDALATMRRRGLLDHRMASNALSMSSGGDSGLVASGRDRGPAHERLERHERAGLLTAHGVGSPTSPQADPASAPDAEAVRFAVRHQWARTVEDVLARRSRLLFLDAQAAKAAAPGVAQVLWETTGVDPQLEAFEATATQWAQWSESGD